MKRFALLVGLILGETLSLAATRSASSPNLTDVLSAYNACQNGDALLIPSGSATWTSTLTIQKTVVVMGGGTNATILTSASGLPLFRILANNIRVTGFGLNGNHKDTSNEGLVQIGDTRGTAACNNTYKISDFRVDHCRFFNVGDNDLENGLTGFPAIMASGYVYGVIDHNEFFNCYGECLDLGADGTGNNPLNPTSLQRSLEFGGYQNGTIFIEDNVWTYSLPVSSGGYGAENAFDGNSGGRWVIRRNTFNVSSNTRVQALISNHETCAPRSCDGGSQGDVGSLMMEIYDNIVNNNGVVGQFVHQRGGRALIYNNIIQGKDTSAAAIVRLSNLRSYRRLGCGAVGARGYSEVAHEFTSGKISEGRLFDKTSLKTSLSSTGSELNIEVASVIDFPSYGGSIIIGAEQIDYKGVSGNILTGCTRAANRSSKAAHSIGASVDLLVFGKCLEQINNTYIWGNKTINGALKNKAELGGDGFAPDYTAYDIQSFAQRPNNWQYRDDGSPYTYTPYQYPHPLVSSQPPPVEPQISVTPATADFGTVTLNTASEISFRVSNVGSGTLVGVATAAAPFVVTQPSSYTISAGASATIKVSYSPASPGTHRGNISFSGAGGVVVPAVGNASSGEDVSFKASAGVIESPFVINADDTVSQPTETELGLGGRAVYAFTIPQAGEYAIIASVIAPAESSNSFFVNLDAEPIDPEMIWDIPVAPGATDRFVTWRGTGAPVPPQTPTFWTLSQGSHQLVVRGREGSVRLSHFTIKARPTAPASLRVQP